MGGRCVIVGLAVLLCASGLARADDDVAVAEEERPGVAVKPARERAVLAELPSVAVFAPTCVDRQFMHDTLYHNFNTQTYKGKLQLVVYDGECKRSKPGRAVTREKKLHDDLRSSFLLEKAGEDGRVMYHFDDDRTATHVGAKRIWMAENTESDLIVHFDDDDYYSPTYIQTMVEAMQANDADLVKLHSWALYGDYRENGAKERTFVHIDYSNSWLKQAFGFTFVFRREILQYAAYQDPPKGNSEDYMFAKTILDNAEDFKFHTIADDDCLVLRVVCYGVHRFSGMPDPEHLAGGELTKLDEGWGEQKCASKDLQPYLDNVDLVYRKHEEEALLRFEQENAAADAAGAQQVAEDAADAIAAPEDTAEPAAPAADATATATATPKHDEL